MNPREAGVEDGWEARPLEAVWKAMDDFYLPEELGGEYMRRDRPAEQADLVASGFHEAPPGHVMVRAA